MANPFTDVENALITAGKFITGVAENLGKLVAGEKALAPAATEAVVTIVTDVESLIALSATAVGSEGLNLSVDSAAFTQFLKLKTDLVAAAPVLASLVEAL